MCDRQFDLTLAIMIINNINIMDKKVKSSNSNNPTLPHSGGGFMSSLVSSIMGKGNKKVPTTVMQTP